MEKYLDAADKEILTPRGPNGSLRGIDKKRKKNNKTNKNESKIMSKKNTIRLTEQDLKRVISESVKKVLNENNKSFDFKKELLRLTQNYLRELYGYAEGFRDSIDNDMELNDAIYQTIESVTDLRDYLKLDEPFKRGVSQGNLSFTDITGDI